MSNEPPVALVTGGSAGIGASICRHFLDAGYRVLNLSRRESAEPHERLLDYPGRPRRRGGDARGDRGTRGRT